MAILHNNLGEATRREVGKSLIDLEMSSIVELYELYYSPIDEPFRFHAGTNAIIKNIIWRGNQYYSSAIEVEGFEANIVGRLPRPKVTVSNKDLLISSILREYSDFRQSKFVRIKVFLKHLDVENFDENINPFGTPDPLSYISKEKYLISQKIIENSNLIQFELITPFDLQSLESASRAIYGKYCYWQYRGSGCNYKGDLICKENDSSFSKKPKSIKNLTGSYRTVQALSFANESEAIEYYSWSDNKNYQEGDIIVVANIDLNGLKDPPYTWFVCIQDHLSSRLTYPNKSISFWEKDGCSKKIEACKKRFLKITDHELMDRNNDFGVMRGILPFGGFPGTDKFKYE
jgi:hypothetical protein